MRAIRVQAFGSPEVLQAQDFPTPEPQAGQVRVRVRAAGVNPVEAYIRSGQYATLPPLPWTPGLDGAGIIDAIGAGVDALAVGDRVYVAGSLTGTYAEFCLCETHQAHRLPPGLSFSQGAALGVPYATAFRALFHRARARKGESVLVHGGSGGVGVAVIQLARAAGLRVIASAGSAAGRQLMRDQGAELVLDHGDDNRWAQVAEFTRGHGVDVIVEMRADINLGHDLTALARGGRVVIVGSRGSVTINPRECMAREAEILGVLLWQMSPADYRAAHLALGLGLESGTLSPVIARELPLEQAAEAHQHVLEASAAGKIVLLP